ncbi:hypothetical protein FZC84_20915 [Rossellomorea vietnamensis]|uniref:Uncharacterized protein n=1 Tax=Rossellomorea vietnamensis TaxID=218284 RepID=A0A5D4M4A8_9BACI|nr:hypothetical protein [Rossellomorea vietnamensis]TYR95895.1 hypothetical protein FZC84_20915 [Rossellomorea vietnamensis]
MKKKVSIVVFFTVLLLAVGAFHYQGTKSTVTASDGEKDSSVAAGLEESTNEDSGQSEERDGEEPQPAEETASSDNDTTAPDDSSSSKRSKDGAPEGESSVSDETADQPDNKQAPEEPSPPHQDRIKFGDDTYIDVTDMEKFKELGAKAKKQGARLYGLENSDLFAFIKDGDPILLFSPGSASANIENLSVLKDFFSGFEEFQVADGMSTNIDVVAKTGAKVDVQFSDSRGYQVFKKDNSIIVGYGDY